jgi:hypothetical protein
MGRPQKTVNSRPLWITVGLLGMLGVALSSGFKPWGAALAGAVLPADLAADAAAAHLFIQRISPYGPAIRAAHMDLTGLPFVATLPYFPHPPFSLIISLPLAFVSFHVGAALWFGFTMALLFALAVLLHKSGPADASVGIGVGPMWLLLFAWPPVLYNLEKGQWSILVAVLLALGWRAVHRGHLRSGVLWAATAASVKVFPAVLGVYFLLRSIRAAGWFVATGILLSAVPLVWIGFDSFPAFIHESRQNLPYWESFPLVMFSIHGAITRALVGGQWAQPFVYAPLFARLIETVLLAGLLGVAIWTTLQARRGTVDHSLALLVWLVLLPLLNPIALGHNGVLLALPLVVLARTLTIVGQQWHRRAWAAALILVSVPNQTVWRFAQPPAGAIEGFAIAALPAWGTLLLFVVAVSVAHMPQRHDRSIEASGKILTSPPVSITVHNSIGRRELTRSKG